MPEATEELDPSQAGPAEDQPVADAGEEAGSEGEAGEAAADEAVQSDEPADDGQQEDEELEDRRVNEEGFSWQASEYVHHHKGAAWYLGLAGVVLIPAIGLVWLHYWPELGALLVGAVAVLVYARKPPRTLGYELSPEGIAIDGRNFPYSSFRSFSVLPDTEWHTIELEPAKRFQPAISVLFDSPDFDQIVGHLELHLPRDDKAPDFIDTLSRRLRF